MKKLAVVLICIISISCKKADKMHADSSAVSDFPLYSIKEINAGSDTLVACGGSRYYRGDIYFSYDDGNSWWAQKGVADKALYDLTVINDSMIYAVGYDGKLLLSKDFGYTWYLKQLDYIPLRRVRVIYDRVFICGGDGLRRGIIYQCSLDGDVIQRDTFLNELSDILLAPDSTIKACGYGIVLSSSNKGKTWVDEDAGGDFFINFIQTTDLFACGMSGTILQYNRGQWIKRCGGNSVFHNNLHLTGMAYNFQNEKWISVGKSNVIIKVSDNGSEQTRIKLNDNQRFNFNNICAHGNSFLLCTDEGYVVNLTGF